MMSSIDSPAANILPTERAVSGAPDQARATAATAELRYPPSRAALLRERQIRDVDILAVVDARGGTAYVASIETGLANRFPFVGAGERKRAIQRALRAGVIVLTSTGALSRSTMEIA